MSRPSSHVPIRSPTGREPARSDHEVVAPGGLRAAAVGLPEVPAARHRRQEPRSLEHAHTHVGRRLEGRVLRHHREVVPRPGEGADPRTGPARAVQQSLLPDEGVPAVAGLALGLGHGESHRDGGVDVHRVGDAGHGSRVGSRPAPSLGQWQGSRRLVALSVTAATHR